MSPSSDSANGRHDTRAGRRGRAGDARREDHGRGAHRGRRARLAAGSQPNVFHAPGAEEHAFPPRHDSASSGGAVLLRRTLSS